MSTETVSPAPSRVRAREVTFGPFEFDPNRRLLRKEGIEIPLPPRVLGVLELLLARAGDVVSRQELIDAVWKDAFVTDTSLAEAVSFLRQALGDDPQSPTYIQTVHRRGYRFLAAIGEPAPPQNQISASDGTFADVAVKPSILNELLPWSAALLACVLAISAVWHSTRLEPVTPPVVRLTIDLEAGWRLDTRASSLAISTSGATVAWSACNKTGCQLFLRALDQLTARAVPETDDAAAPFFSPDERWLGFFATGKLKKVPISGGAPQIIADASQPFGATWMPDGAIVFAASAAGGLMRVREEGGVAELLTMPAPSAGEIRHAFPSSLPDGDGLLFTVVTSPLDGTGRIALLPYRSTASSWRTIVESAESAVAVGREHIAFARNDEVHGIPFDRVRQTAAGIEQIIATGALSPHIAASTTGSFVAAAVPSKGRTVSQPPRWSWTAPAGLPLSSALVDLLEPRLSPDGLRIAGTGVDPRPDIWSVDLQRGTRTRVTYGGAAAAPVWNAEGDEVLYAARGSAAYEIRARPAAGAGSERRVLAVSDRHVFPSSVSSSGDLAFVQIGGTTRSDIGMLRAGQAASLVVQSPFDDVRPALSPNGSLLAYQTDESGRWEIMLVRLRDARRTPISSGGGVAPVWIDDRTLLFQSGDELMRVLIDDAALPNGGVQPVLSLRGATLAGIRRDGNILLHRTITDAPSSVVVTVQWISELRTTLGPPTAASPR